jgi:hypothetical protein
MKNCFFKMKRLLLGLSVVPSFLAFPMYSYAGTSTINLTTKPGGPNPFVYTATNLADVHYDLSLILEFDAHPPISPSNLVVGRLLDVFKTPSLPPGLPVFDPGFVAGVDGEYTVSLTPDDFWSVADKTLLPSSLVDKHLSSTTGSASVTLKHNATNKTIDVFGTVSNTTIPNCPDLSDDCGEIIGTTTFGISIYEFNDTINNTTVSGVAVVKENETVPAPLPILGITAAFGYSRKLRKRIKSSKTPEAVSAID